MTENPLVDVEARLVTWRIGGDLDEGRVSVPWGELWLGQESERGLEVWVRAAEPFDLVLQTQALDVAEHVEPGCHSILITALDRTDVVSDPDPLIPPSVSLVRSPTD